MLAIIVIAAGVAAYVVYDRTSGPDKAAADTACRTTSAQPAPSAVALPDPSVIAVRVLNTTGRDGLAAGVAAELTSRGFAVGEVTNAAPGTTVPGVAEIRYRAQGQLAARVVAAHVARSGVTTVKVTEPGATVDLLLGQGFTALASPEQAAAALVPPSPSPAASGCR